TSVRRIAPGRRVADPWRDEAAGAIIGWGESSQTSTRESGIEPPVVGPRTSRPDHLRMRGAGGSEILFQAERGWEPSWVGRGGSSRRGGNRERRFKWSRPGMGAGNRDHVIGAGEVAVRGVQ